MAPKPKKRKQPPKKVTRRSPPSSGKALPGREEVGGGGSGFPQFGDGNIQYGTLPPLPRNGDKTLHHEYKDGWKHSFLGMGNGKGGIKTNSRFEFWTIGLEFGYGSTGSESQSQLYSAYYSRAFNRMPISISARVPTEKYKEDMQIWIREAQVNMALGEPRILLQIPSADIKVWGFISSFAGGQEAGFNPAPEVNFQFQVTRDMRVDRAGAVSQQVIAYFLDPQDKYWRRESQIFVDNAFDAYQDEIDKAKRDSDAKKGKKNPLVNKDFFDFF